MNGTQTLIAIFGIAAIIGGNWAFKVWLADSRRASENKFNFKINEFNFKIKEMETEQLRLMTDLANRNLELREDLEREIQKHIGLKRAVKQSKIR